MNNPRQNIKTASDKTINKEKLILVRSGGLYGLVFEQAKIEKTSINRGIVSTPTFAFYSNNTKCFIDYSNQTNPAQEKLVEETFSQVAPGTTFEVFNGDYTDPNSLITANVGGIYTFNSYTNCIVNVSVNSGQRLSTNLNRYDRLNFNDIPYFKLKNIGTGTNQFTLVKNIIGKNNKNSFEYYGIKQNDFVKFTGYDTPTKVLEINTDSDGSEYLLLDGILNYEDVISKMTSIEVYIKISDPYLKQTNFENSFAQETFISTRSTQTEPIYNQNEILGSCVETQNQSFLTCTNNNTQFQCSLRNDSQNNIVSSFSPLVYCSTPESLQSIQIDPMESLIRVTNTIASSIASSSSIAGPVFKNSNSTNAFYGRGF